MRRATRLALVFALSMAASPCSPAAHACPNCKEAVAAQPHEVAAMARGYNWSVAFMVSMPFLLLTTGSLAIARGMAHFPSSETDRKETCTQPRAAVLHREPAAPAGCD